MPLDSRQKGKRYEREVAKRIEQAFGVPCRRTPNSGGLSIKGDILSLDGPASRFSWECKRQERADVWAWIEQAKAEARGTLRDWCVVFSRNHEGADYAILDLGTFLALLDSHDKQMRELATRTKEATQ